MRRDVLPHRGGTTKVDGALSFKIPATSAVPALWPGREEPARNGPGPRRFTGRTRSILTTAAVAAILANAAVVWTYWRVAEAGTARGGNGTTVEVAARAKSDPTAPLASGGRGDLLVTLTNNYDFPVRITSVKPGAGKVVADGEHRAAGCTHPEVELTRARFSVRWDVRRNTIGAFTIPAGLIRATGGDKACQGAVFTIPVQASGVARRH